MASKIRHIVVGPTPYDIAGIPDPGTVTTEMLADEAVTQEKLSPDIEFSNPLDSYPVGAVYISYDPTSPAELFGGTWLEMIGVFPYFNGGTETGGSNTHTLTVDELASHRHGIRESSGSGFSSWQTTYSKQNCKYNVDMCDYTGGDQPHNNMPAYQSFYAWRRTE